MRASVKLFQQDFSRMTPQDDGKKVDVFIACLLADLDNARVLAEALDARGYSSAPYIVLNHHDKPQTNIMPQEARCVLTLWTPEATEDRQVKADAFRAGLEGNLIEVSYRKGAPKERYSREAMIVFNRLDPNANGDAWRALFARIKAHCGEPRKKPSEFRRYIPAGITTLAGIVAIAGGAQYYERQVAPHQEPAQEATFTQPAGTIEPILVEARKRPSLTPTTDLALATGGPTSVDQAEFDVDQGTAPKGAAPASTSVEAPKPVAERAEQGPEQ